MSKKHRLWLRQQLPELRAQQVLDADTEQRVIDHYQLGSLPERGSMSVASIILAALGCLLVGGGVILILAHNWEQFGRFTRTVLAFLPLLVAQAIAVFASYPTPRSQSWREAAGALMFCAVPASIAIVGQTYHISDDTQAFLTWWFVLVLPFVYLLRAHLLACLMLALSMALIANYQSPYWLCLLVLAPYYYLVLIKQQEWRSTQFGWLLAMTFAVTTPLIIFDTDLSISKVFVFLAGAGVMYLGGACFEKDQRFKLKPFSNIGAVAMSINALYLTYTEVWSDVLSEPSTRTSHSSSEFVWHASVFEWALVVGVFVLLALVVRRQIWRVLPLGSLVILIAIAVALPQAVINPGFMALIINVAVVAIGFWYVHLGVINENTSQLNLGLLLLMVLLSMRFFDQDLSFITRGVTFIVMGLVLIGVNVWHSRRNGKKSIGEIA